jgi:RNA-directed DNA polymerase
MATEITWIGKKARKDSKCRFTTLYHHVYNEDNLFECYKKLKTNSASGIDNVTKRMYGENLDGRIEELNDRLRRLGYRPLPAKRAYIPKPGSDKERPLGIPCLEDKLVQLSMKRSMEQIYEADFLKCSYGYRKGVSQHDALEDLGMTIQQKHVSYVVEADIKGFFDHVNHEWLMDFLEHRIQDKRILRLTKRFLKAGILEDGLFATTETGTPQGGVLSPLLANVYLHYVLDLWFEKVVKKRSIGEAYLFRYADDFVACFQYKSDAENYLMTLKERLEKFNLELEKSKTKMLTFGRFAEANARKRGSRPSTFDFLGFTHYCGKTRSGIFKVKRKTSRKKFRAKLKEINNWLRKERSHLTKRELFRRTILKMKGHLNYYGITDNLSSCSTFGYHLRCILFKWLNRQSQRRSYNWERYNKALEWWGWPRIRVVHRMCPFQKPAF